MFNRATVQDAVEVAAQMELEALLPGCYDYCKIPVDVEDIAKGKGIFKENVIRSGNEEATLLPTDNGFRVEIAPDKAVSRKRFNLAHEIGHTLFCRDKEHQIGVLSKKELEAENIICEMFAGALLMPAEHVRRFVRTIPNGSPWQILTTLESGSRRFQVSLPALVSRISTVHASPKFSFIILYLQYRENRHTGLEPCLRVQTCSSLGELSNICTWNNRSARGLNMISARTLFARWMDKLNGQREPTGGRYVLSADGKTVRATPESLKWTSERLHFSVLRRGEWSKELLSMRTISCLYASRGWSERQAYVISIIKAPD